ncbi:MAG: transcriptional regulator [Rhodospirillaceae bacterium]|nr:transcriptional regulator [Rhodospirillaceae bacterium]
MELEKITRDADRPTRREYHDACAAAHALDLVGERWALLVIRELMVGPKRFGDLRAGLPGISANVLTQRLDGLIATGIATTRTLPPPASVKVYELTPWGYEAEPIFQALGRWAARSPHHDPSRPISAASFVLSLRTMFDLSRTGGLRGTVGLKLDHESFLARLSYRGFAVDAGEVDSADVVLAGSPQVLAGAVYGGQALAELEAAGLLSIEGDRRLAQRFVTWFPLPQKVDAAGSETVVRPRP